MNIGEKIKLRRVELKLSQRDLSAKSDIPYRTIQQYEAGKFKPKAENMSKLLDALKLPKLSFSNLDELLENDDNSILSLAIGERILAIRYCVGLSMGELCEKTGVTLQELEEYESQKKSPSFEVLYKMSCILKVPAYWLTGVNGEDITAEPPLSDDEYKLIAEKEEESKRKEIKDKIQDCLNIYEYSSEQLNQILEYMIFIANKEWMMKERNPFKNSYEEIFDFLRKVNKDTFP